MKNSLKRGSILIVVVGMVGIMAAVCLTFLAKARIAAAEMTEFTRDAQARICFAAACAYVQETARIGWDDPTTPEHEEAFGWVDVRDGQIGPHTTTLAAAQYDGAGKLIIPTVYRDVVSPSALDVAGRPLWPNIGGISRHPLYRMQQPPFAISADVTPNAIENNVSKPLFGLPLMRKPDPQPANAKTYADYATGDAAVFPGSSRGWFRLFRDGPATFIVTVGAGATEGFRDWAEVVALQKTDLFVGGRDQFNGLLSEEIRQWYRIEWSPAISIRVPSASDGGDGFGNVAWASDHGDWYVHTQTTISEPWSTSTNQAGTIQWIQRLRAPPEVW